MTDVAGWVPDVAGYGVGYGAVIAAITTSTAR